MTTEPRRIVGCFLRDLGPDAEARWESDPHWRAGVYLAAMLTSALLTL